MKKRFPALLLMLAVLIVPAAAAQSYRKQITVDYGIGFSFNGTPVTLKDPNGSTVQPFAYNGTTYVPIRAVSENFGAYISYDSQTNTANVYDDFSEICAMVNEMHNVIDDCYLEMLVEMYDDSKPDTTDLFNENDKRVNNLYNQLIYLESDEGANVNLSIIKEDLMPVYQEFLMAFLTAHNNYKSYRTSTDSYTTNKYVDSLHTAIDKYYAARDVIDKFYKDYCLWRDLTNF